MLSDLIEEVGKFLFRFVVETVFFYTGEVTLYVASWGGRKPRWDFYAGEPPAKFIVLSEITTWIGFMIWVLTIGFVAKALGGG